MIERFFRSLKEKSSGCDPSALSGERSVRSIGGSAGTTRAGRTRPSATGAQDNSGLNNSTWWLDDEGALQIAAKVLGGTNIRRCTTRDSGIGVSGEETRIAD